VFARKRRWNFPNGRESTTPVGTIPDSVAIADINGDGNPDIVVANACAFDNFCEFNGSVGVLLGNGDGTFQPAITYNVA